MSLELPQMLTGQLDTIVPRVTLVLPDLGEFSTERARVSHDSELEMYVSTTPAAKRGTIVVFHGLGGSADSPSVIGTAAAARERGWSVVRVNFRGCGGTAHLAGTLYNATQSDDVGEVMRYVRSLGLPGPFVALGISLGGNQVLRYAARAGADSGADAVVALNPPIDFFMAERAIDRLPNRPLRWSYAARLCRVIDEVRLVRPVAGPEANPWRIRSIRHFDALFTVPHAGYATVDEYYRDASSASELQDIRTRTLIISSRNDPVVPPEMFEPHARIDGPVRIWMSNRGGHLGYWRRRPGAPSRFVVTDAVVNWLESGETG